MKKKIICTALATTMLLSTNASAAPWQMRRNQLIFDSEIGFFGNVTLLDKILSEKELSHTNLCLLIEKIIIHEDEYGLRLEIRMKAPFLEKSYTDEIGMMYEDDYEEVSA